MKISEPIGNSDYGPFFVRVTLGAYFLLAGLIKLDDMPGFITEMQSFKLFPDHVAALFAILLPYVEVASGLLLVIGMWTTMAALAITFLLASFIFAFGLFPTRPDLFNKDIILLGGALSVLYTGAGAFSIDRFRKSG